MADLLSVFDTTGRVIIGIYIYIYIYYFFFPGSFLKCRARFKFKATGNVLLELACVPLNKHADIRSLGCS